MGPVPYPALPKLKNKFAEGLLLASALPCPN
jgi:hypothetical protein